MFVGMALMKWGVFSLEKPARFYRNLSLLGYGVGLPLTIFSAFDLYRHDFDFLYMLRYGGIANYWGSIVVSLGHIGLVKLPVAFGHTDLGVLWLRIRVVWFSAETGPDGVCCRGDRAATRHQSLVARTISVRPGGMDMAISHLPAETADAGRR
jgi:hypothetical protein